MASSSGYSIANRYALVTGSSGGIGRAIALALAEKGAKVAVHYNERHQGAIETQELLGDKCLGVFQCDFRELDEVPDFMRKVQECCRENDGLDILINNAGIVQQQALEDDDEELSSWLDIMSVNLHAPNLLSKLALPDMKRKQTDGESTSGVIINVSSIHGERSNEYMGAYAASKAGLNSFTRTLALEMGPFGIRVNAVAPGVVPVERSMATMSDPTVANAWKSCLPTGRLGHVGQIAQATLSLIENDWITGTVSTIDGGMMARAHMPERKRPPV